MPSAPDEPARRCARRAAERLHQILGEALSAVYLTGSGALGGLVLDEIDIDLVAVCARAPTAEDTSLVEAAVAVRHGDRARTLDPARADRFVREVQALVERAHRRRP
jgi:GrpB-like predicted nucleotidyltransferase (UPF0157 family)